MEIGWDDRLWAIAVPLIIYAADTARRAFIHLLLSLKAAAWWNTVVRNTHDARDDEIEKELRERSAQQDKSLAAFLAQPMFRDAGLVLPYIASELTRTRERLDVMRIEALARHEAESARSQFSDFRIVWLWARSRGSREVKLDGGTTRRILEAAGQCMDEETDGDATPQSPNPAQSTNKTPEPLTNAQATPSITTAPAAPSIPVALPPTVLVTEQLEWFDSFLERGIISPEEFAALKSMLLDWARNVTEARLDRGPQA